MASNNDGRFDKANSDPRFLELGKRKRKVKVDKRFKRMFEDPSFHVTYNYDKYGRKIEQYEKRLNSDISETYRLEKKGNLNTKIKKQILDQTQEILREKKSDQETLRSEKKLKARNSVECEDKAGENSVSITEIKTSRLALLNQDWRYLSATEIFALLSSSLPVDKILKSVTVYPTKLGMEKIEKELREGPIDFLKSLGDIPEKEKVKLYAREKNKYYFALIECESPETARILVENNKEVQLGASQQRLEFQLIPEGKTFTELPFRDKATEVPVDFKPLDFTSTINSQAKSEISWDLPDPKRKVLLRDNIKDDEELNEVDYKEFIGSADSDSDKNEEKTNKKMQFRSILDDIEKDSKKKETDLSISFASGFENVDDKNLQIDFHSQNFKDNLEKIKKHEDFSLEMIDLKEYQKNIESNQTHPAHKSNKNRISEDESTDYEELAPSKGNLKENKQKIYDEQKDLKELKFMKRNCAKKLKKEKKRRSKALRKKEKTEKNNKQDQSGIEDTEEENLRLLVGKDKKESRGFNILKSREKTSKIFKIKNEKKKRKTIRKLGDVHTEENSDNSFEIEKKENSLDEFKIDAKDERFSALLKNKDYGIDTSNPMYKETKTMKNFMEDLRKIKYNTAEKKIVKDVWTSKRGKAALKKKVKDKALQKLIDSVKSRSK